MYSAWEKEVKSLKEGNQVSEMFMDSGDVHVFGVEGRAEKNKQILTI